MDSAGAVTPTLYAGTTLDCALMETVFHDVPFVAGPKMWSKATHVAGKVWSQLALSRDLALIDLSAVPLRKLGISRKDLIAVAASTTEKNIASLLRLVRDASIGDDRLLFLYRLRRSKRPEAAAVLEELAQDPLFAKEIASWKRRSKRKTAKAAGEV